MQCLQEQIQELCQLADQVVANPLKSPTETAKQLHMSAATVRAVCDGRNSYYLPIIGIFLYAWRKYTESQKRKQEKERMLREIIAKQQAVIRKLEIEITRMKRENAQNQIEVENLKKMLYLLEQAIEQVKTAA